MPSASGLAVIVVAFALVAALWVAVDHEEGYLKADLDTLPCLRLAVAYLSSALPANRTQLEKRISRLREECAGYRHHGIPDNVRCQPRKWCVLALLLPAPGLFARDTPSIAS
jgi:hypothetical protein